MVSDLDSWSPSITDLPLTSAAYRRKAKVELMFYAPHHPLGTRTSLQDPEYQQPDQTAYPTLGMRGGT